MSYFNRRTGSRSEAEDLTQDVLLRVVQRREDLEAATADAFVFTVAANLLRDRARRSRSHSTHAHGSVSEEPPAANGRVELALVEGLDPERVLIGKESIQALIEALNGLDEATRDTFLLCRLEHMKHRELAELYGISVSAVEKRVAKALAHIAMRASRP